MEVLFILIIISLVVAGGFLLAFIFSVKNGQYDDTYTPSVRMLFDEELITKKEKSNYKKSNQKKENVRTT